MRWNVKGEQLVRGGVANGKEGRVDAIIASDADGAYTKYVGTQSRHQWQPATSPMTRI